MRDEVREGVGRPSVLTDASLMNCMLVVPSCRRLVWKDFG